MFTPVEEGVASLVYHSLSAFVSLEIRACALLRHLVNSPAIMAYEACLRKTVPVSGKNDSFCPNSVLLLPDKATTFGRIISPETNVRLLSKNTPLMISRRHSTISVSAGKWTIIDHEVKKRSCSILYLGTF